jgi:hypothetical protein
MDEPTPAVDVNSVLRRTRRRRLPKRAAAGGVLTLAIGGIAVAGFQGLSGLSQSSGGSSDSAASTAEDSGGTSELFSSGDTSSSDLSKRAPADRINLCGGAVADVAPSATGLVLTTEFGTESAASVGAKSVTGVVTMTNEGTETVTGSTAVSPAITLSQDGVVLWHSNGAMIDMATVVDLAPGESMEYQASFVPVICDVEDDLADSFRDDLPEAPVGVYEVSALIDLSTDMGVELISGPPSTFSIRKGL